ncbi:hypothetical protein VUR80DRAFT_7901 [Thermomyces stellatus]
MFAESATQGLGQEKTLGRLSGEVLLIISAKRPRAASTAPVCCARTATASALGKWLGGETGVGSLSGIFGQWGLQDLVGWLSLHLISGRAALCSRTAISLGGCPTGPRCYPAPTVRRSVFWDTQTSSSGAPIWGRRISRRRVSELLCTHACYPEQAEWDCHLLLSPSPPLVGSLTPIGVFQTNQRVLEGTGGGRGVCAPRAEGSALGVGFVG